MNQSEEPLVPKEPKEFLTLKSVVGLIDATVLIVVFTGALYFWGYIYYAVFTETVGAPYHGVSLPIQDYLVASWQAVIYMLLLVIAGLWLFHAVSVGVHKLAVRLRNRKPRTENNLNAGEFEPPYAQLAIATTVAVAVLFGGLKIVLPQAKKEADNVLKAKIEMVIRGTDGHPIDGRFIYLRDFGSTLLVREMSADLKTVVGARWFKEGSYTGYSLLDTKPEDSGKVALPPK